MPRFIMLTPLYVRDKSSLEKLLLLKKIYDIFITVSSKEKKILQIKHANFITSISGDFAI